MDKTTVEVQVPKIISVNTIGENSMKARSGTKT